MSQQYICANLVKTHPILQEIRCKQAFPNILRPCVTLQIKSLSPNKKKKKKKKKKKLGLDHQNLINILVRIPIIYLCKFVKIYLFLFEMG